MSLVFSDNYFLTQLQTNITRAGERRKGRKRSHVLLFIHPNSCSTDESRISVPLHTSDSRLPFTAHSHTDSICRLPSCPLGLQGIPKRCCVFQLRRVYRSPASYCRGDKSSSEHLNVFTNVCASLESVYTG